jgi:succinoglycan biosynthesis protein ExoV
MNLAGWFGNGITPNLGDVLNPYIFFKMFDEDAFHSTNQDSHFIGIGSTLHPNYLTLNKNSKNIVFGAGIRDFHRSLSKYNLDIYFVRGQLSASALNCEYISDAAYLFALLNEYNQYTNISRDKKKYKISYMPYIHTLNSIDWQLVSEHTGINIIYPTEDVQEILTKVSKSQFMLSSAMHGCIIADILRIPFRRVKLVHQEGVNRKSWADKKIAKNTQEVKWADWLSSIDHTEMSTVEIIHENHPQKKDNYKVTQELINVFSSINLSGFTNSSDDSFQGIITSMQNQLHAFSNNYEIPLRMNEIRVLPEFNAARTTTRPNYAYKQDTLTTVAIWMNVISNTLFQTLKYLKRTLTSTLGIRCL